MNFVVFFQKPESSDLSTKLIQGVETTQAAIAHAKRHELDPEDEVLGALPAAEVEVLAKLARARPVIPDFILNVSYAPKMQGAKKSWTWTEFVIENQETLTRAELENIANDLLQGKPVKIGGGAAGDFTLTFVKPAKTPSPHEVAERVLASLDIGSIAYAGDPARGETRGTAALGDFSDQNQILIDAGMPPLDGTPERIALLNVYIAVVDRRIIDRASQFQMADTFADLARGVVSTWSKGDLAGSIRQLDAALREYETLDEIVAANKVTSEAEASTAGREDVAGIFLSSTAAHPAAPSKRR